MATFWQETEPAVLNSNPDCNRSANPSHHLKNLALTQQKKKIKKQKLKKKFEKGT